MLHDFAHIITFMAENKGQRPCLSCYLYGKQHKIWILTWNIGQKLTIWINTEKPGESMQKAI